MYNPVGNVIGQEKYAYPLFIHGDRLTPLNQVERPSLKLWSSKIVKLYQLVAETTSSLYKGGVDTRRICHLPSPVHSFTTVRLNPNLLGIPFGVGLKHVFATWRLVSPFCIFL